MGKSVDMGVAVNEFYNAVREPGSEEAASGAEEGREFRGGGVLVPCVRRAGSMEQGELW